MSDLILVEEAAAKKAFSFIFNLMLEADKAGAVAQVNIGPEGVKQMREIAGMGLVYDK